MRGTIRAAVVVEDRRQPDRGVGDCAAPAEDGQVTAAVVGDPSTGEISPPTLESDSIVGGAAPALHHDLLLIARGPSTVAACGS
jgi:hypothetical protein